MSQFPELITMSRHECERFVAGPDDVCISIRDPDPSGLFEIPRLSANYRAVFVAEFHDLPTADYESVDDTQQINGKIADEVVAFVLGHRNARRLVIHCEMGRSRSVSLAMALADCFGVTYSPTVMIRRGQRAPNEFVFDAIRAAYRRAT